MFTTTLSQTAQEALALLGNSHILDLGYLAGGSALALHYGHRYSYDFDFFTENEFDEKQIVKQLYSIGSFTPTTIEHKTILGTFCGIKFSYFYYDYPLIAPTTDYLGIHLSHPHDVAAMKLVAMMDRGTKRDFIDLYQLVQQGLSLEIMLDLYEKKYGTLASNQFSLIKSVGYFDDAEDDEMPKMIFPVTWDRVKTFFTSESIRLGKKFLMN